MVWEGKGAQAQRGNSDAQKCSREIQRRAAEEKRESFFVKMGQ